MRVRQSSPYPLRRSEIERSTGYRQIFSRRNQSRIYRCNFIGINSQFLIGYRPIPFSRQIEIRMIRITQRCCFIRLGPISNFNTVVVRQPVSHTARHITRKSVRPVRRKIRHGNGTVVTAIHLPDLFRKSDSSVQRVDTPIVQRQPIANAVYRERSPADAVGHTSHNAPHITFLRIQITV